MLKIGRLCCKSYIVRVSADLALALVENNTALGLSKCFLLLKGGGLGGGEEVWGGGTRRFCSLHSKTCHQ